MSQNHFTLSFPLKSPADSKGLAEDLPPLMAQMFQAADTIGTIHSSRFTILDEKTLLFLGDFDGEFGGLMAALAKAGGPVFDAIFPHVDNPPPTPVADHTDAFVEWAAEHLLQAATLFSAYPDVTAQEIKAMAAAADFTGSVKQLPFLVILPIKSTLAYVEVQLLLRARSRRTQKDLRTVGTPILPSSFPWGATGLGSLLSMTAPSISILPISPNTSDRSLTWSSNLFRTRRPHHAESISRSLSTLRRERTVPRSASI